MADGTKVGPITLRGKVVNRSKETVWVLFDRDGTVTAKQLLPSHSSPSEVDADAVKAHTPGQTIDGHTEWWKLPSVLLATVGSNLIFDGLNISGDIPGLMSKTTEADWGTINYDHVDQSWGVKLKWYQ